MKDRAKKGRYILGIGGPRKLSAAEVKMILRDPRHHAEIGTDFGVTKACIQKIKSGKTWISLDRNAVMADAFGDLPMMG